MATAVYKARSAILEKKKKSWVESLRDYLSSLVGCTFKQKNRGHLKFQKNILNPSITFAKCGLVTTRAR
jgi:hypothetical protein